MELTYTILLLLGYFCAVDAELYFVPEYTVNIQNRLRNVIETDGTLPQDSTAKTFVGFLECIDTDVDRLVDKPIITLLEGSFLEIDPINEDRTRVYKKAIDYEVVSEDLDQQNRKKITFTCENRGLRTEYTANIVVIDLNDNAPVFQRRDGSSELYTVEIDEKINSTENRVLIYDEFSPNPIIVKDKDGIDNNKITAQCLGMQTDSGRVPCDGYFAVEEKGFAFGEYYILVYALRKVYTDRSYTLEIRAENLPLNASFKPQYSTTQNVAINIREIQDLPPLIRDRSLTYEMLESLKPGFRLDGNISAYDQDIYDPHPIRFRIVRPVSDNPGDQYAYDQNFFSLGDVFQSGIDYNVPLILNNSVDREDIRENSKVLFLGIEAIEYDPLERENRQKGTASATIRIKINDVNDQAPEFSEDYYSIIVNEISGVSANPNNSLQISNEITIIVKDSDSDLYNQFKVDIIAGSINENFGLDEEPFGSKEKLFSLYAKERILDHESPQREYILVLQATDLGNPLFTSMATVNITITDINDHPPVFDKQTEVISIPEDQPVGTSIGSVTATDRDSGAFGTIVSYTIIGNNEFFSIFPNGTIVLEQAVDYESVLTYNFIVVARDGGGGNELEGSINVNVLISNREDNVPVFLNIPYFSTLIENQLTLLPGITALAQSREADAGPMQYTIAEVRPNTVAIDSFSIGFSSGQLSVLKGINYKSTSAENPGIVEVHIRAQAGSLSSKTIALIEILDRNDEPPEFIPRSAGNKFYATVTELANRGDVVIDLEVEDKDGADNDNGRVFFQIETGANDAFSIDRDTGVIRVSNTVYLDREKYQTDYTIVVLASDYGQPRKSSSATVFVELLDSNNKDPVFEKVLYRFQLKASADQGTEIGRVKASDPDSAAILKYSLDLPSVRFLKSFSPVNNPDLKPDNVMKVDVERGIISVAGEIERAIYDRINFNIKVEDININKTFQSAQVATASVVVFILAANDTEPYFTNRGWTKANPFLSLVFSESSDPRNRNIQIMTLRAYDPAIPEFITDFRKVDSSDPGDYFQVDQSFVYIKKLMDYDVLPVDDKTLSVTVLAVTRDGLRSANVTITVTVRDLNDNAPKFLQPDGYVFEIEEGARPPAEVGRVMATDIDSKSYGQVNYAISGEQTDFSIYTEQRGNQYEGVIIVAEGAVLDYESSQLYNLVIVANDNPSGTETVKLSTNVDVVIRLLDKNDQAPGCEHEAYNVSVIGTRKIDEPVFVFEAIDGDAGRNGEVTYSLPSATNDGTLYFGVTTEVVTSDRLGQVTNKGSIVVRSSLDRLPDRSVFELNVMVTDGGRIPLRGTCKVIITVSKGVQDLKPKWVENLPATVYIPENQPVNTSVVTLTANAATIKSRIIYSFVGAGDASRDYNKFRINPDTGEIRTTVVLDYEEQIIYSLLVLATDSENNTLTNQYLLIVRVIDVDDNLPSFDDCPGKQYTVPELANVDEALPPPVHVYQAQACDRDSTPFNTVSYSWFIDGGYCPDNREVFTLNNETGQIDTKVRLDRESVAEYLLCVEASRPNQANIEKDLTSLNNSNKLLFVKVAVNDMNDLGPKFYEPSVKTVILQYPSADISVAEAYDLDSPPNNGIRYTIDNIDFTIKGKTQNAPTAFTINANDGAISIGTNDYSEYIGGYFDITVRAEDYNGANVPYDQQLQRVYVTDRASRVRVIFEEPADSGVDKKANDMIDELNELYEDSGMYYEIETISYHVVSNNADPSFDKTDVCLVMVEDDQVLSSVSASKRLTDVRTIRTILNKYGAVDPGSCDPAVSVYPVGWESYWWVLVAFAIFIFVCCIILIFIIVVLYREYKQYMNSRKTYLVPGN